MGNHCRTWRKKLTHTVMLILLQHQTSRMVGPSISPSKWYAVSHSTQRTPFWCTCDLLLLRWNWGGTDIHPNIFQQNIIWHGSLEGSPHSEPNVFWRIEGAHKWNIVDQWVRTRQVHDFHFQNPIQLKRKLFLRDRKKNKTLHKINIEWFELLLSDLRYIQNCAEHIFSGFQIFEFSLKISRCTEFGGSTENTNENWTS